MPYMVGPGVIVLGSPQLNPFVKPNKLWYQSRWLKPVQTSAYIK